MELITDDLIRILLAVVVGTIVGIEREYHGKTAGIRTMILITVGSTLFTILSQKIGSQTDGSRIIANLLTGIGFLGAGVIFRDENRVRGVTTAATIWTASALGLGLGAGYIVLTFVVLVVVIFVLTVFSYLQDFIENLNEQKRYKIVCVFSSEVLNKYELLFTANNLKYKRMKQDRTIDKITLIWDIRGRVKNHNKVVDLLIKDMTILEFDI